MTVQEYEREITRAYIRSDNEEAHRLEAELYKTYPKWAVGDIPDENNN